MGYIMGESTNQGSREAALGSQGSKWLELANTPVCGFLQKVHDELIQGWGSPEQGPQEEIGGL
jgi:hypothetical protein